VAPIASLCLQDDHQQTPKAAREIYAPLAVLAQSRATIGPARNNRIVEHSQHPTVSLVVAHQGAVAGPLAVAAWL